MKLTFVTGNPHKVKAATAILQGLDLEFHSLSLPEIQSFSMQEIVESKARMAFDAVRKPVLVEDVAFDLDALGGFPGPFAKFWFQQVGYDRAAEIAIKMGNQRAVGRCMAGFCDGERVICVEGRVPGVIVPKRGEGFGFDPYFVPDGHTQTFAEMGDEKKNTLSHRAQALLGIRQRLIEAGLIA